ncbi:class I SAM-dependent methyltransferase [Tautonia sociabilis]|uniref:SAM-dependent methyltransferase n=1 Tax=Tautonia sociabilis TaxID=2080755 RepID=A0A432MMF5_9BACT|nr:class I SAM-dependent methyltransferase [Tautonia sociabilis]RUL88623.1 SAM-dependent methyltransferase [Tautonia sociabilis]
MRDHNKAFCRLVSEAFDCPGPIVEFGAYQVEGQEGFADLRSLFPGTPYIGCDMRSGPGVDRVEDVSAMTLADESAGTVICLETFEHVFEVRRAFDEVYRVLKPGGLFILTSPFHFRIHGYPDDYWRMTPSCLGRMLECYALRVVGQQGPVKTPHTVMSVGIKHPAPADAVERAERLADAYRCWLNAREAAIPPLEKARRRLAMLYRSKAERAQIRDEHAVRFSIDGTAAEAHAVARAG